jgi:hypothetical protein
MEYKSNPCKLTKVLDFKSDLNPNPILVKKKQIRGIGLYFKSDLNPNPILVKKTNP